MQTDFELWRRVILAMALSLLACEKGSKPRQVQPAPSKPAVSSPRGQLTTTLQGETATAAIDSAVAFDMEGGSGINLAVGCPSAPSGCRLAPGHGPIDPASIGCPGGRLVLLHFAAPLAQLVAGPYTQSGAVPATVGMMWMSGGQMNLSADNWTDALGALVQVGKTELQGTLDARFADGSVAVKGRFKAPVCP